ncbi:glycosyltransferase family 2 protein [Patescibacteria group bacterium]|nr:glycosyltransferase family 2 protein [Patescibacteria group bacterium]
MPKKISVIIPVFNEEKNLDPLFAEISAVFANLNYAAEIIFINDGSTDKSVEILENIARNNEQVKVLVFSRNFGKELATSAGCHFSRGDAVITMDADLQHPPQIISELIRKWEEGFEVVYTVRQENKGASLTKKITSSLYYWLFNKISSVNSEPHSTDFRLMDKKVIDEFKKFSERSRIFRGIIDWMGYKRARIEFTAPERNSGKISYSYRKLFALAINSITAFSLLPLRIAGYFGIFITIISSIVLLIIALSEIFNFTVFSPITIIAVANTFLMGVVLICLGFIALYIARIHDESSGRPLYIIRNKINLE